jgi:TetR/AcrR family transcriptional regulator
VAPNGQTAARDRILRAAETVFARKGYAGATTREIARAAGIQKRMLFYYFPGKERLYVATLDCFLERVRDIHSRFHGDPGPVGLGHVIAGLVRLVVLNPDPVRILMREIMDDGPHLRRIVERYVGPLFAAGIAETGRNMERGVFRREEPLQVLVNIGGLTVFYFVIAPLLRLVSGRDPLHPEAIERRIEAARRFALAAMLVAPEKATTTATTGRRGRRARVLPRTAGGASAMGRD